MLNHAAMRRWVEHGVVVSALALGAIASACTGSILDPGDETGSGSGGSGGFSTNPNNVPSGVVGRSPLRRLSAREYVNTLEDLFPGVTLPAVELPSESELHGFDNNAEVQVASAALVEAYDESARAVATAVAATNPAGCTPATPEEETSCGQSYLGELAPRAYRRPLEAGETARLNAFFETARTTWGFEKAVELSIAAVLQTPQFLYRLEFSVDGADEHGAIPLSSWEIATRLSYFLTGTMPDAELFAAAELGTLADDAVLETQAKRLLGTARARQMVVAFHSQWLDLGRLGKTSKDQSLFPEFDEALRASMKTETERFVEHHVFDGAGTLRALLTSSETFVDAELAPLYGISVGGSGPTLIELDPAKRAGIFTQASFLAGHAHPKISSPVLRGVTLLESLLCHVPDPPPPGVDTSVTAGQTPGGTAKTTREIYEQHVNDDACKNCHTQIDPLGMPFESFDAVGRHRTHENGVPVDSTATVLDLNGDGAEVFVKDAVDLAHKLADSPRVLSCVTTQWFRFAMGKSETDEDAPAITTTFERTRAADGKLDELMLGIVRTKAFRTRKLESQK